MLIMSVASYWRGARDEIGLIANAYYANMLHHVSGEGKSKQCGHVPNEIQISSCEHHDRSCIMNVHRKAWNMKIGWYKDVSFLFSIPARKYLSRSSFCALLLFALRLGWLPMYCSVVLCCVIVQYHTTVRIHSTYTEKEWKQAMQFWVRQKH